MPEKNQIEVTTKRFRILKAVSGIQYFNPQRWISHASYERGSVISVAWQNVKDTWLRTRERNAKRETFQQAIKRLGLTPQILATRRQELCVGSRLCYFSATLILLYSMFHAYHGNIFGGISGVLIFIAGSFCGFARAFRAWQIDTKRFGSFIEFVSTPEAWFI